MFLTSFAPSEVGNLQLGADRLLTLFVSTVFL